MSAEKPHELSLDDVNKANSTMSYGQYEASEKRGGRLKFELQPRRGSLYHRETALNDYDTELARLENTKADEYPPEWKSDLEKAKKIQSEIRQKFAELDGLFKLD